MHASREEGGDGVVLYGGVGGLEGVSLKWAHDWDAFGLFAVWACACIEGLGGRRGIVGTDFLFI